MGTFRAPKYAFCFLFRPKRARLCGTGRPSAPTAGSALTIYYNVLALQLVKNIVTQCCNTTTQQFRALLARKERVRGLAVFVVGNTVVCNS